MAQNVFIFLFVAVFCVCVLNIKIDYAGGYFMLWYGSYNNRKFVRLFKI